MYTQTTLNNGIRVFSHNMPGMNSLSFGIWINAGSRNEGKDENGIAHLIEHMLFKGSKRYSCRMIKEKIEGVGGSLNGFTSQELTCYFVKIPAEFSSLAVSVLSDMVLNPLMDETELAKEKHVIIEEIKMYKDLPQAYVHDLIDQLLWPKHPLGINIAGTEESVAALSRKSLVEFKNKFYNPKNVVITLAGKIDQDESLSEIRGIFNLLSNPGENIFLKSCDSDGRFKIKVLDKQTEQSHLAMGFHGISRDDPRRYALALLHIILGGNMSSRLFNEVREERGLAYEIGTSVKTFKDSGAFLVHAGFDTENAAKVIEVILAELFRVKNELVSEDELKRAKDFYIGQMKIALDDTLEHMLWIGEPATVLNKVFTQDEVCDKIQAVSRQDLTQIARELFLKKDLNVALIGPLAKKEKEINDRVSNLKD